MEPPGFRFAKGVNGKMCENCLVMVEEGRVIMRCGRYDKKVNWRNVCDSWEWDETTVIETPEPPKKLVRNWVTEDPYGRERA